MKKQVLQIPNVPQDVRIRLRRLKEFYPNLSLSGVYNKALITGLQFIEREVREIKLNE